MLTDVNGRGCVESLLKLKYRPPSAWRPVFGFSIRRRYALRGKAGGAAERGVAA